METGPEPTTVAFELAALKALADPAAVFKQTQQWARSVGIVSNDATYTATKFARDHGLDYGFHPGPRDVLDALVAVRAQPEHEADRYLLIGTEGINAEEVARRGWAFLPIEEAAEAADWQLASDAHGSTQESNEHSGWP